MWCTVMVHHYVKEVNDMSNSIIPADTVDSNGASYPSIGEHIRNKSVSAGNIATCINDNTDRAKVCDKLDVSALELKQAILNLLTGKSAYFGGLDIDKFSNSELAEIKAYLGIV